MLKKDFIRDGSRKIIGSVTTGYRGGTSDVRDEHNEIVGRTSDRFETTRDGPTHREPTCVFRSEGLSAVEQRCLDRCGW
jgi:hypothetical protein